MRPKGTLQTHMAVPDRCQQWELWPTQSLFELQFHQQNHTSNTAADHYFGVAVFTAGPTGTFSTAWLLKQEVFVIVLQWCNHFGKLPQSGYRVILSIKQLVWPQCFWMMPPSTKGITTGSTKYAASCQKHGRGTVLILLKLYTIWEGKGIIKKMRVFCIPKAGRK